MRYRKSSQIMLAAAGVFLLLWSWGMSEDDKMNTAEQPKVDLEAPLPEGWPELTPVGVVQVKQYPVVRMAMTKDDEARNGQFRVLFNHIKKHDIPMTSPVVMRYDEEIIEKPEAMGEPVAMAFLYQNTSEGEKGVENNVEVLETEPVTVVSVGLRGAYSNSRFKTGLDMLNVYLEEHPELKPVGPPRVLAYNSPFKLWWKKYSEVQIPVSRVDVEEKKSTMSEEPKKEKEMPPLSREEKRVILGRGTERAFTGKYWNHFEDGAYACRKCGTLLYLSDSKFKSNCGWPSFDDEVESAVKQLPDPDGMRVEIRCQKCDGHLGHVFTGERLTETNVRHCVNSISLAFVPEEELDLETAILAGGCFWGVEHFLQKIDGVLSVKSGYTGGKNDRPTYQQVSTGRTNHAEAVEVVFDPKRTSFEKIAKRFFEIHDPTTLNRQGPDRGTQYRSAIFYKSEEQKKTAEKLIAQLKANGYDVVTELVPAEEFWPAEEYHQDYVKKHPGKQLCHAPVDRFGDKDDKSEK